MRKGSLECLKVTVGGRNQVGLVGSDDDSGRNGGTENGENSEYCAGGFDSKPHDGLGEGWPEEKEEEHSSLVENQELESRSLSAEEHGD